jgi:hypothetical protein
MNINMFCRCSLFPSWSGFLNDFEMVSVACIITGGYYLFICLFVYVSVRLFVHSFYSHSILCGSQNCTTVTSYSLFCQKLPDSTLCITVFCTRIYRAGRRLSSIKLPCNIFEIIPVMDSTSGITQAVFNRHILVSSSFKPVCFLEPFQ